VNRGLLRALTAEAIGTFALVFAGAGAANSTGPLSGAYAAV
jgi:glycerol uptake facilitator-like aquaporin